MSLTSINTTSPAGSFDLLATQDTDLPELRNTSDKPLIVAITAEGQWRLINFETSDPSIIKYKTKVDGDGYARDKNDEKFKFKYPKLNPAALVAEVKDAKGNVKSSVGGKKQDVALLPGESVSFIMNDDPAYFKNNDGQVKIKYAIKKGKIVVNSDEWAFTNTGFQNSPDAAKFAINVAKYFVGEGKGKFHAFSNNFGLIESSLEQTLTQAGHTWTKGTNITIDLPTLSKYDGIFLASDPVDNQVLIQYVKNGGKVYLAAGTGLKNDKNFRDNPQAEADRWNTFLAEFGLKLEGTYNSIVGNLAPNQAHPLFDGVKTLYYGGGNFIVDLKPESPLNQIVQTHSSGQGLIATAEFDPAANLLWAGVWAGGAIISVDGNKLTIDMTFDRNRPKATGTIDANDPTKATVTFPDGPDGGPVTHKAELSNGKITWFLASNSALWGFWDRSKYWFA